MNKYESIIIVNPSLDDEALKALEDKFTEIINNDGKVEEVKNLGKKKLAYQIQKKEEAFYIEFDFEAKPELIAELQRVYRITDDVMKFIVIRKED